MLYKAISLENKSLAQKAVKGTFWLFCFRVADQIIRLARTIILARLLAPKDFGLFGIALVSISFLEALSQSGFMQALIQKKGDIKTYLNTSWVVQIVRGFLLALALFFLAPQIAIFFNTPEAEQILKVISLVVLVQGFSNIALVYFSKELEFHKYFYYQIIGTIVDFAVAVSIALIFRNVWALVLGFLAGNIARTAVSYFIYSWRPRFKFEIQKAKELFGYGKWIFGSNIIGFFITQIDSLFVAKLSGVISLGFYQIAYRVPVMLGTEILTGAIFPAYSKIQDDAQKIREAYLKILQIFSFILIPLAGGIFILAPEFITLFLGEKWLPSLWPMRVLSLSVLIWTFAVISNYLFLATGRPHIETKWILIKMLLMLALLYHFITWWGITGAALAVLVGSFAASAGFSWQAVKIVKCKAKEFLSRIFIPLINALIMVFVILLFKIILPVSILNFLFLIIMGVLIYGFLTYLSDKFFKYNMFNLLKENINLAIK